MALAAVVRLDPVSEGAPAGAPDGWIRDTAVPTPKHIPSPPNSVSLLEVLRTEEPDPEPQPARVGGKEFLGTWVQHVVRAWYLYDCEGLLLETRTAQYFEIAWTTPSQPSVTDTMEVRVAPWPGVDFPHRVVAAVTGTAKYISVAEDDPEKESWWFDASSAPSWDEGFPSPSGGEVRDGVGGDVARDPWGSPLQGSDPNSPVPPPGWATDFDQFATVFFRSHFLEVTYCDPLPFAPATGGSAFDQGGD